MQIGYSSGAIKFQTQTDRLIYYLFHFILLLLYTFFFIFPNRNPSFIIKSPPPPPPRPHVTPSCKTSNVCVKICPLCHLRGPRQYPLSSHSSNYPSVSPQRQMLSEPSSIRHSTAAWQTQYGEGGRKKKKQTITLCTVT